MVLSLGPGLVQPNPDTMARPQALTRLGPHALVLLLYLSAHQWPCAVAYTTASSGLRGAMLPRQRAAQPIITANAGRPKTGPPIITGKTGQPKTGQPIIMPDEGRLKVMMDESKLDAREIEECLSFLRTHMPQADRAHVTPQQLRQNVILALAARAAHPWALDVPWTLFLNDVLPYATLDEPREAWRAMFAPLFGALVANVTSLTEAAQVLNRDIWGLWGIVFKSDQTPEILSPSQVIKAGYASCTGLSIFLVDACRAVGIPARVAGTPSWVTAPPPPAQPPKALPSSTPAPTSTHSTASWHPSHPATGTPSHPGIAITTWHSIASWLSSWLPLKKIHNGDSDDAVTGWDGHGAVGGGGAHTVSWPSNHDLSKDHHPEEHSKLQLNPHSLSHQPNHDFNNHDWVEVWDGGRWSFLGAAEYDVRGPNRTWFFPDPAKRQLPGSKWHSIYASSFARQPACDGTTFPLIWDEEWEVPGCDVTQSYLDAEVLQQ